jgi:hypothetical protein
MEWPDVSIKNLPFGNCKSKLAQQLPRHIENVRILLALAKESPILLMKQISEL